MKSESENEIQAAFFSWLALHEKKYPELSLFYAIPNGTNKSIVARVMHKRTGLKSGVPDCHLPIRKLGLQDGTKHGLWIEFKSKTGGVSENQRRWHLWLDLYDHQVEICRSWIDAANITIEYLGLPIKKIETNP